MTQPDIHKDTFLWFLAIIASILIVGLISGLWLCTREQAVVIAKQSVAINQAQGEIKMCRELQDAIAGDQR